MARQNPFSLMEWQVCQRSENGTASLMVQGQLGSQHDQTRTYHARLCLESSGAPASEHLDHVQITVDSQGDWKLLLERVPAGGPYRFELNGPGFFSCLHHLCVGDIWVIAGQSNAGGYSGGFIEDPPEIGVHQLAADHRWSLAAHPLGDGWGHSPLLQFGKLLKNALGVPIGLVPLGAGGSGLAEWNPCEGEAPLYRRMISTIKSTGGPVKGMIWYQGCTDAGNPQTASTYAERFRAFVDRLRCDLGQPDLPVVMTQLNRIRGPADKQSDWNWSTVREQQVLCARTIPHTAIVPAHDLGLSDAIHTSAESNLVLASRYAQAALGLTRPGREVCRPAEIQYARLNRTRDVLTITFSHVPIGLVAVSEEICDFIVEDGGCEVNYTIPERYLYFTNQVVLHLARPVSEKTVIRFCYGRNPESSLRRYRDMIPPLACMEMPVSTADQA